MLQGFSGTAAQALSAARSDNRELFIHEILGYQGNPERRSEMLFLVKFEDSTSDWLTFTAIEPTIQFDDFCRSYDPSLTMLLTSLENLKALHAEIKRTKIKPTLTDTSVYVNVRTLHYDRYDNMDTLPNHLCTNYFLPATYGRINARANTIALTIPLLNYSVTVTPYYIHYHGHKSSLKPADVLITEDNIKMFDIKSLVK